MKKLLNILLLVLLANVATAQTADNYNFLQGTRTYTAISGTTVFTAVPTTWDEEVTTSGAVPIGFTFTYCGTAYTSIGVTANGWINLGATAPANTYTPLSNATGGNIKISPFSTDLYGNGIGTIQYLTTGSAPNRVFTIQWRNARRYLDANGGRNFQIKLHETSNVIEFCYGNHVTTTATTRTAQVGLKGPASTNYINRTTTTNWAATTPGGTNSVTCTFNNTINPDSGRLFSWAPPASLITNTGEVFAGSTRTLGNASAASGGTWSSSNSSVATVGSTGVVFGVSAGTATITYMWATAAFVTTVITVNASAAVYSVSGGGSYCSGGSGVAVGLSNSEIGVNYQLYNGSTAIGSTVSGTGSAISFGLQTVAGSYSVLATHAASSSTVAMTGSVAVSIFLTTPSVGVITGASTVCTGTAISLTNSLTGGTWSSSNITVATVGSTGIVIGIASGTATISYTVTNACGNGVATKVITVSPSPCAGDIIDAPLEIAYQAVARNSSGTILTSTPISVRFSIRDSIATGTIKYVETFSVTTSDQGMFSVNVGQGSPVTGSFLGINWGVNSKFLQVALDPAGGSSYIDMGTTQMMSVPYALHSGSFKFNISITGDTLYSGSGNYVIIPGISAANSSPYAGTIMGPSTVCAGSSITLTDSVAGGAWSSSNTSVATIGSTGIVTGIAAGTTTISYTVTNILGSSYASKVVTVNPLPIAGTLTGAAALCVGSITTLSNAITGGTWSSGSISVATIGSTGIVNGVASGTSTISYTVTNSCGVAFAAIVVTVSTAPSAGTITGPNAVAVSTTITLSNSVIGGSWISSNTAVATIGSTGVILGVSAGTVLISYAVSGSCEPVYATYTVTVSSVSLTLGTSYGGGKIFYILQPGDLGYISGETHGLIAAISDQNPSVLDGRPWGAADMFIGGTSTLLGTGSSNTSIVSAVSGVSWAARICADLILGGYSDWYLPSRDELYKLYVNRSYVGGFYISSISPSLCHYWSSSEFDAITAWNINFYYGTTGFASLKGEGHNVRAIRSF